MSARATILDNLETTLKAIMSDDTYESQIAMVSRFDENVSALSNAKFPLVVIADTGPEELVVWDSTHYRYITQISLVCFVKSQTLADVHTDLNKLITTLKGFIDSGPSLGSNVLSFEFVRIDNNAYETKTEIFGRSVIDARIRYVCAAGSF